MVIKEQVRINTKGDTSGSSSNNNNNDAMSKNLIKIAASVGATAIIWKGLEPLLTPLIKLLSLIALVIFLPLLPYVKSMAKKLADVVKEIRSGQEGTPGEAFVGGIGALIDDNIWELAGIAIAGAFVLALTGGSVIGALALALAAAVTWEFIGSVDDIEGALTTAGFAFLATSIAALMLGAGTQSLGLGLLAAELTLGFSLLHIAMTEEDWRVAVLEGLGGSLLVGAVGSKIIGGVLAAMGIGVGSLTIPLAALTFVMFAEWKWGIFGKAADFLKDQLQSIRDIPEKLDTGNYNIWEAIFGKKQKGSDIIADMELCVIDTVDNIAKIRAAAELEMPLVIEQNENVSSSVLATSGEYTKMATNSSIQVAKINKSLDSLNRTVVTTHIIKTINESSNRSSIF